MKYRTTQPFMAFGKVAEPGDIVELTDEQAAALNDLDVISGYETRVDPLPENKVKKKRLGLSRRGRLRRLMTARN